MPLTRPRGCEEEGAMAAIRRQEIGRGDTPPTDERSSKWWSPEQRRGTATREGRERWRRARALSLPRFIRALIPQLCPAVTGQALFMWLGMAQQTKPRGPSRLLVVVTKPGLEVVQGESQRSLGGQQPWGTLWVCAPGTARRPAAPGTNAEGLVGTQCWSWPGRSLRSPGGALVGAGRPLSVDRCP